MGGDAWRGAGWGGRGVRFRWGVAGDPGVEMGVGGADRGRGGGDGGGGNGGGRGVGGVGHRGAVMGLEERVCGEVCVLGGRKWLLWRWELGVRGGGGGQSGGSAGGSR
ncbi:unnamed protein product [Dicrocoelium dendriticum]|nr:unnamed protein product [Dicrocoelium dendriticum]